MFFIINFLSYLQTTNSNLADKIVAEMFNFNTQEDFYIHIKKQYKKELKEFIKKQKELKEIIEELER